MPRLGGMRTCLLIEKRPATAHFNPRIETRNDKRFTNDESQRITDVSLGWLSLFQAQLRGLASLFYGSERITQDEFLNALDLIEEADDMSNRWANKSASRANRERDRGFLRGPGNRRGVGERWR